MKNNYVLNFFFFRSWNASTLRRSIITQAIFNFYSAPGISDHFIYPFDHSAETTLSQFQLYLKKSPETVFHKILIRSNFHALILQIHTSFKIKCILTLFPFSISLSCRAVSTDLPDPLCYPSPSSIAPVRSSSLHPVSAQSCCI